VYVACIFGFVGLGYFAEIRYRSRAEVILERRSSRLFEGLLEGLINVPTTP
jgi:hypothetical protein